MASGNNGVDITGAVQAANSTAQNVSDTKTQVDDATKAISRLEKQKESAQRDQAFNKEHLDSIDAEIQKMQAQIDEAEANAAKLAEWSTPEGKAKYDDPNLTAEQNAAALQELKVKVTSVYNLDPDTGYSMGESSVDGWKQDIASEEVKKIPYQEGYDKATADIAAIDSKIETYSQQVADGNTKLAAENSNEADKTEVKATGASVTDSYVPTDTGVTPSPQANGDKDAKQAAPPQAEIKGSGGVYGDQPDQKNVNPGYGNQYQTRDSVAKTKAGNEKDSTQVGSPDSSAAASAAKDKSEAKHGGIDVNTDTRYMAPNKVKTLNNANKDNQVASPDSSAAKDKSEAKHGGIDVNTDTRYMAPDKVKALNNANKDNPVAGKTAAQSTTIDAFRYQEATGMIDKEAQAKSAEVQAKYKANMEEIAAKQVASAEKGNSDYATNNGGNTDNTVASPEADGAAAQSASTGELTYDQQMNYIKLALGCIRGDYGNGEERAKAIGEEDYALVQPLINEFYNPDMKTLNQDRINSAYDKVNAYDAERNQKMAERATEGVEVDGEEVESQAGI